MCMDVVYEMLVISMYINFITQHRGKLFGIYYLEHIAIILHSPTIIIKHVTINHYSIIGEPF